MDKRSTDNFSFTSSVQTLQVNLFNRWYAIQKAMQQSAGQEVKDALVSSSLAQVDGMVNVKTYYAYPAATSTVDAMQMFKERFGYVPQVTRTGGAVLCQLKESEREANNIIKEGERDAPEKLQGVQYELDI